jgi:hypothetical protein
LIDKDTPGRSIINGRSVHHQDEWIFVVVGIKVWNEPTTGKSLGWVIQGDSRAIMKCIHPLCFSGGINDGEERS